MTSSKPVRIGLVGAGSVGAKHVRAAASVAEVEVAGVCDVIRDRADALGRAHGIPVFADLDELAAEADIEAVVVAVPTADHARVAVVAARQNLHVLVEKPMATSIEDCDAIIAAGRATGVVVGVCHVMQRQHARLRAAKRVIDGGDLGEIVMMSVRRTAHYRSQGRPAWMYDASLSGGGVMFNTGTYAIEEFQWLAGAAVRRVVGAIPGRSQPGSIETEGMALLELDNDVSASIVELGSHYPSTEEMNIVLEHGSLHLSHAGGLWQYLAGTGTQLVEPSDPPQADYSQALSYQLADFGRAVRAGHATEADGAWGRSVVAAATALYESARQRQPVSVPGQPRQAIRPAARPSASRR